MILNEELAKKQKITDKQRSNLNLLYNDLNYVKNKVSTMSVSELEYPNNKKIVEQIEKIEYLLQANWNFPQDKKYHTWWNRIAHCSCPKLDNLERFGQEKIISCSCPIHGYLCTNN